MSDWRDQASCLDSDPELFFPVGSTGPALIQIEDAKAVCRDCAVQEACLEWAIESGQNFGVWGALSEGERRNLKRRRARRGDAQPCGTTAGYSRHYRDGNAPCPACREAHSIAHRARRVARQASA